MIDTIWNDLEVASKSTVMQAARQFAEVLAESPQFQAFEQALFNFRQDAEAQSAIQDFQKRQASLKALRMLNAVSAEDRQELQTLVDRVNQQPSVIAYDQAQGALAAVSQELGDLLSQAIGLDYASVCRKGGCCAKDSEMTANIAGVSSTLLEATSSLAENLAQSEPFLRYKAAEQRLHADQQAMQLLSDLSALQQKIRRQQNTGAVSQKDLTQLSALKSAADTKETIQDHLLTQELATAFLREVNQEISQLLGIDFASLARRSSGCC